MYVVELMDIADSVGSVRGGPGRWEGECRPGCKTNVAPETQDEEGDCRGRRCGPLHADPQHALEGHLEAHAEARTGEGVRRGRGHYATHSEDLQVAKGSHGVRIGLVDAADAHARERGGK